MIVFRSLVIFLTTPIAEAGWQEMHYEVSLFKSSVGRTLKNEKMYQCLSTSRQISTYSEGYLFLFFTYRNLLF